MSIFNKRKPDPVSPAFTPAFNPMSYVSPLVVPPAPVPVVATHMPQILDLDPLPYGVADEIVDGSLSMQSLSQIIQVREEEMSYLETDFQEIRELLELAAEKLDPADGETRALILSINNRLVQSYANEAIAHSRLHSDTARMTIQELQRRLA